MNIRAFTEINYAVADIFSHFACSCVQQTSTGSSCATSRAIIDERGSHVDPINPPDLHSRLSILQPPCIHFANRDKMAGCSFLHRRRGDPALPWLSARANTARPVRAVRVQAQQQKGE